MRLVSKEIRDAIERCPYDVDPDLIEAIIMRESSGNPNVKDRYEPGFYKQYIVKMGLPETEGRKRATSYGLMQIMYQSAIEDGYQGSPEVLRQIDVGINWGVRHLRKKIKFYGVQDINRAIAAYNAGSPRWKDGKFVNQGYVDGVNGFLKKIKGV
jgi:soluble lytic murein transglycosylase-like protein